LSFLLLLKKQLKKATKQCKYTTVRIH